MIKVRRLRRTAALATVYLRLRSHRFRCSVRQLCAGSAKLQPEATLAVAQNARPDLSWEGEEQSAALDYIAATADFLCTEMLAASVQSARWRQCSRTQALLQKSDL